jgi:preprotein translocase subunit SecG
MVVGETLELFIVFAMVIISIIIVMLIQRATGGVDEEE